MLKIWNFSVQIFTRNDLLSQPHKSRIEQFQLSQLALSKFQTPPLAPQPSTPQNLPAPEVEQVFNSQPSLEETTPNLVSNIPEIPIVDLEDRLRQIALKEQAQECLRNKVNKIVLNLTLKRSEGIQKFTSTSLFLILKFVSS